MKDPSFHGHWQIEMMVKTGKHEKHTVWNVCFFSDAKLFDPQKNAVQCSQISILRCGISNHFGLSNLEMGRDGDGKPGHWEG